MKQLNALEKHLDLKLLDRTNQGIRLTAAGRVIYRYAKGIFDRSEQALAEARKEEARFSTTFCIGSSILNPLQALYGPVVSGQRGLSWLPAAHCPL